MGLVVLRFRGKVAGMAVDGLVEYLGSLGSLRGVGVGVVGLRNRKN